MSMMKKMKKTLQMVMAALLLTLAVGTDVGITDEGSVVVGSKLCDSCTQINSITWGGGGGL
jgi:hypothetical protein